MKTFHKSLVLAPKGLFSCVSITASRKRAYKIILRARHPLPINRYTGTFLMGAIHGPFYSCHDVHVLTNSNVILLVVAVGKMAKPQS